MPKRPASAPAEDGGRVKRTKFTKVIFDNTPEQKIKKVKDIPPTTATTTNTLPDVKKKKNNAAKVVKQKKAKVSVVAPPAPVPAVASTPVVVISKASAVVVKQKKAKKVPVAPITVPTSTSTTTTVASSTTATAATTTTATAPVKKAKVPNSDAAATSESKKALRLKAKTDEKLTAAGMTPEKIVLYHAARAAKLEHYRKVSQNQSVNRLKKSINAEERLTLGRAMKTYLLSRSDLSALEAAKILIPKFQVNPHYACAAPMRLYLVSALQEVTIAKYGGETGFAEKIYKSLTRGMGN